MEKEKKINFFTNFYVSYENCANLKKKNLLIISLSHLEKKLKDKFLRKKISNNVRGNRKREIWSFGYNLFLLKLKTKN